MLHFEVETSPSSSFRLGELFKISQEINLLIMGLGIVPPFVPRCTWCMQMSTTRSLSILPTEETTVGPILTHAN